MNVFDLVATISIDTSGYKNGLDDAKNITDTASGNISAKTIAMGNAIYDAWKKVATGVTKIAKYSIDTGAQFDSSMSQVAAISGATGKDFDDLRQKAMEMGASTKFSATESAEAFTYMAMAGWKTVDMLDGIEGIMNLAAAAGENLATTSDIVTDALTAFGLSAKDSGRFADVLAAASSNANTNVSMLGESFKYVAPVAGSLGYSAEDTAVALGLMANSGIKASQAGTALRTTLTNMAKPTDSMQVAMDTLGVSLEDDEGHMYSLMDVMQQLRIGFGGGQMSAEEFSEKLAELDEQFANGTGSEEGYEIALGRLMVAMYGAEGAQKAELATMLAGKEGMSGLLAIVNASDEDFQKLTDSIYGADGAAEQMAATMVDNLAGDVTLLKSAIEGVQIALSDKLTPSLRTGTQFLTNLAGRAQEFIENGGIDQIIQQFTDLSPVIAAAAVAFVAYKAATAISGIMEALTKATEAQTVAQMALNAVMNANPFVLVATLIAAVGTALVTLYMTNEDFRNKVNAVWNSVKETISGAVSAIKTFFTETIPNAAQKALDWFSSIPKKMREVGANLIEGLWAGIAEKVEWLKSKITGVVDTIKGWFTGADGFDEHSPSKWANQVFRYVMEGGGEGLEAGLPGLLGDVSNVVDSVKSGMDFGTANVDFAASAVGQSSSAIVNSVSGGGTGVSGPISVTIPVMLQDGTVLARAILPDLIKVASAAGTPITSTGYA